MPLFTSLRKYGDQMNKPHKHAELIKAWADGAEIQGNLGGTWEDLDHPDWSLDAGKYRIKPEPVYPVTRMSDQDLKTAFFPYGILECTEDDLESYRGVANAAIRRAIQDGDVVLPGEKA